MNDFDLVRKMVVDMERTTPYLYEGLYGNFLRRFMDTDKSKWTKDLAGYLSVSSFGWSGKSDEIADILWDRFLKRISC